MEINSRATSNKEISKLSSIIDSQIGIMNYEICRYFNDISIDLRNQTEYRNGWNLGFDFRQDNDLERSPSTNVIKSIIDTLVSKISQSKVRPYFNAVDGSYTTHTLIRQVQKYFDITFDENKVHSLVSDAFRNACIFGKGHIYLDPFDNKIKQLQPWCYGEVHTEVGYGKPTQSLIKFNNFPTRLIDKYDGNRDNVQYCIYNDVNNGISYEIINNVVTRTATIKSNPVATIYYNKPVFGTRTIGIVQELDGIQTNIDLAYSKVSADLQLTPASTTYVLKGSNIEAADLNNRTGNIYTVATNSVNGSSSIPVHVEKRAPFDMAWIQAIDDLTKKAFDQIGISQLSAQSQKPNGLDSGAALQTMEDIESDRFETQVSNYIRMYTDLAELLIDNLPDDNEIIPSTYFGSSYTWKDVKKQSDLYKIQYSAASILSKDPQTKLQQIMNLSQIGLITPDQVAALADLPDIEDAYSEMRAVKDAINKVIEDAIEDEIYEIPDFVSYEGLAKEITVVENKLYASFGSSKKENKKVKDSLDRIMKLEDKLLEIMEENGYNETEETEAEQMVTEDGTAGVVGGTTQAADITSTLNNNVDGNVSDDLNNYDPTNFNSEEL